MLATVALACAAAAGATVGLTALTRVSEDAAAPQRRACPSGPPLELDLGVRADREARSLRRAAAIYARGERAAAHRTFERYASLEARVGAAISLWPNGTLVVLRRLAAEHEGSGLVQLHLGVARFCAGERRSAETAWRAAERLDPDSAYAVRAADFLHPELAPGLPGFVLEFRAPSELAGLSPAGQLAALAARARRDGFRGKLLYGAALQRLGRPVSARRQFDAAARLAPGDPEAQVAAAVGRFDKDDPSAAFGRLGPLTRRFPRAATVRFHLGLLLLWIGRAEQGREQLERARQLEPRSPLAKEAGRFLARLGG